MAVKKLLFKGNNWLGDVIMSLPTIKASKKIFPQTKIAVVTKHTLAEIYQGLDYVDEVIPYKLEKGLKALKGIRQIARILKKKRFDCAIIFPRSLSSAFMIYTAGIPERIGYKGDARSPFLTKAVNRDKIITSIHRVYYFLNLLTPIYKGNIVPEPPEMSVPPQLKQWADEIFNKYKRKKIIGFNPGATYGSAKMWKIERFIEVAKKLLDSYNCIIVVFGTETETDIADRFCEGLNNSDRILNFVGKTTLLQLCALVSKCDLLITNDTGTMHVADALKVPIVAIFGSTDPNITSPFGDKKTIINHPVDCSPCFLRKCPKDLKCMNMITAEEVYHSAVKWLEAT